MLHRLPRLPEEELVIEHRTLLDGLKDQVRVLETDLHGSAGSASSRVLEEINQAACAWVLATVFTRLCEDNQLIDAPFLAGSEGRLSFATERQQAHYRQHPDRNDRDWIVAALDALSMSAATLHLFDTLHAMMREFPISHEAAKGLIAFWRSLDETGRLVHEFTDPSLDTGFLADAYAHLSDTAQKKYALLQTPPFVADFILDRTVKSALGTYGRHGLRIIDPVCGSGTFLLGAFERLLAAWRRAEPDANSWTQIGRVLVSIHGVDKNPIAVVICRFRLLMAAITAAGADRLVEVPELPLIIATGDSLAPDSSKANGRYADIGDYAALALDLLAPGSYDAVIGNPPYITVKDRDENELYRSIYPACRGKYALTVPFIVRFFGLARSGEERAGFVGLLVSNAFMKREFGRPLVEEFLPTVELTHVVDTSGAYIPGHGTPTVILLGRSRWSETSVVRTVLSGRGESSQPEDPTAGVVWQAIIGQLDHPGSESEWVSVADVDRAQFATHPWSLASSGAREMLATVEAGPQLSTRTVRIGYYAATGSDDIFVASPEVFRRVGAEDDPTITIVTGSEVRDWAVAPQACAFFPGEDAAHPIDITQFPGHVRRFWPYRTTLRNRTISRMTQPGTAARQTWYGWHQVATRPEAHPWSLTFPWVATHQHFVVLREGIGPLQSAPVVKLPRAASHDMFFDLEALLNSSIACFWLKQYSQSKGAPKADQLRPEEPWERFYEFTSTTLEKFPLPLMLPQGFGRELDGMAQQLAATEPTAVCAGGTPSRERLDAACAEYERIRGRMVAVQEELDWDVYRLYGLLSDAEAAELVAKPEDVPELELGQRAFEIVMARQIAGGELDTQWFARHRSAPVTDIPDRWPQAYQNVVAKRIEVIEENLFIALIEQPAYKRRWQTEPWKDKERKALTNWLLDRCEERALWYGPDGQPRPVTVNRLADRLRADPRMTQVARLRNGPEADLADVLRDILDQEHVPYLAQLRYRAEGVLKRFIWEQTWDRQREEDRTGEWQDIPIPPTYTSSDFVKNSYWRHRGKLDVPKERFISYPYASPDSDSSLLLGWAGWDHAEQAVALITLIEERYATYGWGVEKIKPLLAGLAQVMPWVRQWHDKAEPAFGISPADAYGGYLIAQRQRHGLTEDDLRAWAAPPVRRGRPPKAHTGAADHEAKAQ
jgi:hypothetical protein